MICCAVTGKRVTSREPSLCSIVAALPSCEKEGAALTDMSGRSSRSICASVSDGLHADDHPSVHEAVLVRRR